MKDHNMITEEYKKGDFEKRLNLFLECPILREEFMQIEQDDARAQRVQSLVPDRSQVRRKKSSFNPWARLLKCCQFLIY